MTSSILSRTDSTLSNQKGKLRRAGESLVQDVSYLSTTRSHTTVDTDAVESYLSRVTEEDKMLAMLGHKDLNRVCGTDGVFYYREEFCGACGIVHSNPDVLDTYLNCERCHYVVREPAVLRKRFDHTRQRIPLEVLFASYGDPFIPQSAREVTQLLQGRVSALVPPDRILFGTKEKANAIFGFDPSPGQNKQLRVRYRIDNTFATLMLDFDRNGQIPTPFILTVPRMKYVKIHSASYGHPKGLSKTGRMSVDVQEILQSLIDQNGGAYLQITVYTPLARLLGDPCPGYRKDLRIAYEVLGKAGEATYPVVHNQIPHRVFISSAPTIAPIIFVARATYGITPSAKKEKLDQLHRELKKVEAIEHRQSQGIPAQADEIKLLRSKDKLQEMFNIIRDSETNFLDVSVKMQRIVDEKKYMVKMDRKAFDCNAVFGNPCPGLPKILDVFLDCQGHDSEKRTESNDMTDTGYIRNYIAVKTGRFTIMVRDDAQGKGVLQESLSFETSYVAPMVIITRALYGELDDMSKVMDVTFDLQAMAKGRGLEIAAGTNLTDLFRIDPSPGRNKQLKISYISRGYAGNLRVREKEDCLCAGLELGYPPQVTSGDDDVFHKSRFL